MITESLRCGGTEDVTERDTGRNPCSPEHRSGGADWQHTGKQTAWVLEGTKARRGKAEGGQHPGPEVQGRPRSRGGQRKAQLVKAWRRQGNKSYRHRGEKRSEPRGNTRRPQGQHAHECGERQPQGGVMAWAREPAPGEAPGSPRPPKGFGSCSACSRKPLQVRSRAADRTERLTWAAVWSETAVSWGRRRAGPTPGWGGQERTRGRQQYTLGNWGCFLHQPVTR